MKPDVRQRRAAPQPPIVKFCEQCSLPFSVSASEAPNRHTCSKKCMGLGFRMRMRGTGNPNFRYHVNAVCEGCGEAFKRYGPYRRFCSVPCAHVYQSAMGRKQSAMRQASRADDNQDEIVDGLRKAFVSVVVTSSIGSGFPDLLCATKEKTALLEIKNPASAYGKRGLNKLQAAFAKAWRGELYVVTSIQEALIAMGVMACPEGVLPPPDYGWGAYESRQQ